MHIAAIRRSHRPWASRVYIRPGTAPQPVVPMQRNALRAALELNDVALPAQTEGEGVYTQTARYDRIAAAFTQAPVMRALMHKLALDRAKVFCPLLLDVYQRPLSPAEAEMLQSGDHQTIVLVIFHQLFRESAPAVHLL